MRVFLPNLAFEDELAGRELCHTSESFRAARELGVLMSLLAEAGDVVLSDCANPPPHSNDVLFRSEVDADTALHGKLVPWGWTKPTLNAAQRFQLAANAPLIDVVRRINSRSFNVQFDTVVFDETNPIGSFAEESFGKMCYQNASVLKFVSAMAAEGFSGCVAKAQLSHAGRNRLWLDGTQLNDRQSGWLRKRLPGGVYIEPVVERLCDAGLQFEIRTADGEAEVRFLGVTELLTDKAGRYLGSVLHTDSSWYTLWSQAIEHGAVVCRHAAAKGYFGPIGIDCFRFRLPSGQTALRVCNDINARFTMGRLALQLRRFLRPGETGVWAHVRSKSFSAFLEGMRKTLGQSVFCDVRPIVTSPETIGNVSVQHGTVFLAGADTKLLKTAAQSIRTF